MNTTNHAPSARGRPLGRLATLAGVLIGLALGGPATAAAPAANSKIENSATASYIDSNNTQRTVDSNTASITVAQVYSATLVNDRATTATAGAEVVFAHTLVNTGNGIDDYSFSVVQDGGDSGQLGNLRVVLDTNNNNLPDDGPTNTFAVGATGTVTIDPSVDPDVQLLVVGTVPATAVDTNTFKATITVQGHQGTGSAVPGSVTDAGANGDALTAANDGDDTNNDIVTVTDGAILDVTKNAVYNDNGTPGDLSDDTIRYSVSVTNNGNEAAYDVELVDVINADFHDLDSATIVADIQATLVTNGDFADGAGNHEGGGFDWTRFGGSPAGAGLCEVAASGCTTDAAGVPGAKPIATNDANGDGTTGDIGIRGHDDVLSPGFSVSFAFTVKVEPTLTGGATIPNTATATAYLDGDGTPDETGEAEASATSEPVPTVRSMVIEDTNAGKLLGTSDGGDDDANGAGTGLGNGNDSQLVDTARAGEAVIFQHVLYNTGTVADRYVLSVPVPGTAGNTFPAGTTFRFEDAAGNTLVSNTTGVVGSGGNLTIRMIATLPSGAAAGGPFTATVTAVSANDTGVTDTTAATLTALTAGGVDLSNDDTVANGGAPDGSSAADRHAFTTTPITTLSGDPGDTVRFPLTISNDSAASQSFTLSAGKGVFGGALLAIHQGWSVSFTDVNGNTGNQTVSIPADGTLVVYADVTISSDPTRALREAGDFDVDGDGNDESISTNDSDGDYPIVFRVVSNSNASAVDTKLDAVDVNDKENVTLTQGRVGQVNPNGSKNYAHTLSNVGNTVENFALSSSDNNGFSSFAEVRDNTGAFVKFSTLVVGSTVQVTDKDGNTVLRTLISEGGNPVIPLQPGDVLDINVRVVAPNVGDGTVNNTTLTASYNAGGASLTNVDQTTVVLGNIELTKTAALDKLCDGTPDFAFAETATQQVQPGECVIWQIVATNVGAATVTAVEISDVVQAFTQLLAGSLRSCAGDTGLTPAGCTTVVSESAGNDTAQVIGSQVTFWVGSGAADGVGGSLTGGSAHTVRFGVKVDQ